MTVEEHKHKYIEWNRLHHRSVSYSNVVCEDCGEKFEHVLWHGVMNTVTREVNELNPKTLPDYDYHDGFETYYRGLKEGKKE